MPIVTENYTTERTRLSGRTVNPLKMVRPHLVVPMKVISIKQGDKFLTYIEWSEQIRKLNEPIVTTRYDRYEKYGHYCNKWRNLNE